MNLVSNLYINIIGNQILFSLKKNSKMRCIICIIGVVKAYWDLGIIRYGGTYIISTASVVEGFDNV